MRVRGAVLERVGGGWSVEDLELAPPGPREVRIRMVASGLCHSDEHFRSGDIDIELPVIGGHEGAGIVDAVGPGVTRCRVGDHVVLSFIPACGSCPWCAIGRQALCDSGATSLGGQMPDGTFRFSRADGSGIGGTCMLGTFANWSVVPEISVVPIDRDVPLELACILGCAIPTGWGSSANAAGVGVGDTVIIVGLGGVGIAALQSAAAAGARHVLGVDPVAWKQSAALELGATASYESLFDAAEAARLVTNGQGADAVVIAVGEPDGEIIGEAVGAVRKAGTVVLTGAASSKVRSIDVAPLELTMYAKRLVGTLYGESNPTVDIPKLVDHYRSGQLDLNSIVTRRYELDDIEEACSDLHAGRNFRGVIVHAHGDAVSP
jgi:NDMA-dependent alcohol dehydrogenase